MYLHTVYFTCDIGTLQYVMLLTFKGSKFEKRRKFLAFIKNVQNISHEYKSIDLS